MPLGQIRSRFGPHGVTDFAEAYGRAGAITGAIRLTAPTAEGLLSGQSGLAAVLDNAARTLRTLGSNLHWGYPLDSRSHKM